MTSSLLSNIFKSRVSSVLNKDVKQFGKKFLFDNNEETCWNSDQGSPQFIQLDFEHPVSLQELHIKFQGGFAGRDCHVEGTDCCGKSEKIGDFYPSDVNSLQIFSFNSSAMYASLKIIFTNSTDFFGRITIYHFDVIGTVIK